MEKRWPFILIVDDEDDILSLLSYNLKAAGFRTGVARDGIEALSTAEGDPPDLVVLDIMMPRMDGMETCRAFRQHAVLRKTPILMLTAMPGDEKQIEGLDVGADIYLSKPISIPVLISQVRALLRTASREEATPDILTIRGLRIDRDRYRVFLSEEEEEELRFPRKEFELLYFLAAHPGNVFSRQELLDNIWGTDVYVVDRTVDVHIRKVREKIGDHYIETVKGVGYRFTE
jgi:two-component system alkaline phosphatase synthesis response regulator PhoP